MNTFISRYKEIDKARFSRFLFLGLIGLISLLSYLAYNSIKNAGLMSVTVSMMSAGQFLKFARLLTYLGLVALIFDYISYEGERNHIDRILGVSTFVFLSYTFVKISPFIKAISKSGKISNGGGLGDFFGELLGGLSQGFETIQEIYLIYFVVIMALFTLAFNIYKLVTGKAFVIYDLNFASASIPNVSNVTTVTNLDLESTQASVKLSNLAIDEVKENSTIIDNSISSQTLNQVPVNNYSNNNQSANVEPLPQIKINKKALIGVLVSVSIVLIAFFGYSYWDKNLNLTHVDLFQNIDVEFSGINENGRAELRRTFSTVNNPAIDNFLDTVSFEFDTNQALSNDQEINLIARIDDHEEPKRLKLKIDTFSKSFKVEGLPSYVKSLADITEVQPLLDQLENGVNLENKKIVGYYYADSKSKEFNLSEPTILIALASNQSYFGREEGKYNYISMYGLGNLVKSTDGEITGQVSSYTLKSFYMEEYGSFEDAVESVNQLGIEKLKGN